MGGRGRWRVKGEGWGPHSSTVSLLPSQQQLKQVCLFTRATEGKRWSHMVKDGHT